MGEAADNKILLLLKQTRRQEENEANKLLQILRNRPKIIEPQKEKPRERLDSRNENPPAEVLSIPGLSALHLFSFLKEDSFKRLTTLLKESQATKGGWLHYFMTAEPFIASEIAGLPNLPVNEELKTYRVKLSLFLHRLMVQWRLEKAIFSEELQVQELDELLIQLLEKLKILVQQGRLQQIGSLDSSQKIITFLCILKPDSFATASRFLQKNKGSLFAHLAFMLAIMAQEVVIKGPGQLKEAIAVGESLQRLREKLNILIHRMALRSHLGRGGWDENMHFAGLITTLFGQLEQLFTRSDLEHVEDPRNGAEDSRLEGGEDGLF